MSILLLGGSPAAVSSTGRLLDHVGDKLAGYGHRHSKIQVRDLPAQALLHADTSDLAIKRALAAVADADAIVIATPVYKASFTGLLKTFLDLLPQRQAFQDDPAAVAAFLAALGVTAAERAAFKVSLFCYSHAPVAALFDGWRDGGEPLVCLVPEGVAREAVESFLGAAATAGAVATHGALTVRVLPFVPQPDYDRLLWSCDLNFVRGEDSFVRAQWAGKPFVWHIYPQDEDLHHKKLRAFLQRYADDRGDGDLAAFSLHWNGATGPGDWRQLWAGLRADLPRLTVRAQDWQQQMLMNGDLAANLLAFAATLR